MGKLRSWSAVVAIAWLCCSCHWPPLILGGVAGSYEEAYLLIGSAAPVPASAADSARQDEADSLLAGRWSSFGLHYHVGTAKVSHLQLAAGDYPTTTAAPQAVHFPYEAYGPPEESAELSTGNLALAGDAATWTIHPPDAGTLTGVVLTGSFSAGAANDIVKELHQLHPTGPPDPSDPYLHSSTTFTVTWTVVGQAGGTPFTAHFMQTFAGERLSYGENI